MPNIGFIKATQLHISEQQSGSSMRVIALDIVATSRSPGKTEANGHEGKKLQWVESHLAQNNVVAFFQIQLFKHQKIIVAVCQDSLLGPLISAASSKTFPLSQG